MRDTSLHIAASFLAVIRNINRTHNFGEDAEPRLTLRDALRIAAKPHTGTNFVPEMPRNIASQVVPF